MPAFRQIARQGSSLLFASFLVVASSRVAADTPDAHEVAERWQKRQPFDDPADVRQRVRDATGRELTEHQARRLDRALERRRGRAVGTLGRKSAFGPAGFHAGATGAPELIPQNPLLDPGGLFGDETGEEPPFGAGVRLDLADFDGDGDLDAFVGDKYGYVRYFENTAGPGEEPVYEERTGAASPTGSLALSETGDGGEPFGPSAPTLVDVDDDGDLDLFVGQGEGESGGRVLFFENDGSGNLTRNDAGNPLAGFMEGDVGATPTFSDVDQDGDFDALVGMKLDGGPVGEVYYLENTGDAMNPVFVDRTDVAGEDPLAGLTFDGSTAPAFADVDGDGDEDAFVGEADQIRFFDNRTVLPGPPLFVEQTGSDNPSFGGNCTGPAPALGDVDGDGDLDAFVGSGYLKSDLGRALYLENTGTANAPAFLSAGDRLELVDVDGDGDLDALVSRFEIPVAEGAGDLEILVFQNQGSDSEPVWRLQSGADNPFFTFNTAYDYGATGDAYDFPSVAPTIGLLDDGDSRLDAFVGRTDGTVEYLADDGTGQLDPAATHPLEAVVFGGGDGADVDPHLVDVDGDGELDLVVGYNVYDSVDEVYGSRVAFFLNETGADGIDATPDLVLDTSDLVSRPAPALADVDGDGDADLYLGGYADDVTSLFLLENRAASPGGLDFDPGSAELVEVVTAIPSSPAWGDVNGDGLLDLAIGDLCGTEWFLSASPRLEVAKVVSGGTLTAGGTVEYTIRIENVGSGDQPDDPDSAELTDVLPPELALQSASVASGPGTVSADPGTNTVTYDGALVVGETVEIRVTANLGDETSGQVIVNQAVASYDTNLDGTNDTDEPSDDPATADSNDGTAFVVDASSSVLEIPTLSEWGAILFGGLLSLAGLLGIRRMG